MVRDTFVTSDGVSLSFEDTGSGHPLVFIHGWAATGRFWRFQVEELSKRYRTVVPDLRGHGDSQKETDLDFSVSRMVKDLRELVDHLGLESFITVGHSLGGVIAARLASLAEACTGLILIGTPESIPSGRSVILMKGLMRWRVLASKFITPRMFGPRARQELLDFVRSESAKSSTETLTAVLNQTAGEPLLTHGTAPKVPVLVVSGEHDAAVNPKVQRKVAQMLGATNEEIPGAGHNLMLERPAELNRIIERFAESIWRS